MEREFEQILITSKKTFTVVNGEEESDRKNMLMVHWMPADIPNVIKASIGHILGETTQGKPFHGGLRLTCGPKT